MRLIIYIIRNLDFKLKFLYYYEGKMWISPEVKILSLQNQGRRIREAYRDFDTSFVDDFVKDLYSGIEDPDYYIEKYKINIIQEDGDDYVVGASYIPNLDQYVLKLSDPAFDTIEAKLDKEELKNQIEAAFIHEFVHRQQNQGKMKDQKIITVEEDKDGYYSQKHEVDAYVANIIAEWFSVLKDRKLIQDKLGKSDFSDLSEDSQELIKHYQKLGKSVYQHLLSELYRRLNQEPSTYNSDPLAMKSVLRRKVKEKNLDLSQYKIIY